MNNWIKISDGIYPKEHQRVIISVSPNWIERPNTHFTAPARFEQMTFLEHDTGDYFGGFQQKDITGWQPFPEPLNL